MERFRIAGFLGIAACIVFWTAMLVFGRLRPSYSQSLDAISELGALGTPNAVLWNVIGFITPGLLLAAEGRAIAVSVDSKQSRSGRIARWLLPLFGLAVAGQGFVPARMANGELIVTSWLTRGHLIMSLISAIAWVFATLMLVAPMKRDPNWRGLHIINLAAVLLVIAGSIALRGALPDGLVQRLIDAVVFAWFVLMSVKLVGLGTKGTPLSSS
jgi:hypothetical membrane protein